MSASDTQAYHVGDSDLPPSGPSPMDQPRRSHRRWLLPLFAVAGITLLFFGIKALLGGSNQANEALIYYQVKRADLPIIVTEQGNLESQVTEEVICEVENFGGDRTGNTGTRILFIVENGSRVEEGDLLVELDSAPLQERLDTQFLTLQRAEADKIQAEVAYDNQITQNETALADAELRVELAKIDLKMFEDEAGGTYQIDLQNIEMDILAAQADQLIKESDQKAIQILYGLGYKSKGDLANARLQLLGADSKLASTLAQRRQLTEYTYNMQKLQLQGELETAKRALEQVRKDNESSEAEALATKISEQRAYEKEKERYERYKDQVAKCTIRAPQTGMVAYSMPEGRGGNQTTIEEGAYVRQRQEILTLPNLERMQVSTAVHESVLDQVKAGMPATIRVDAFPDLIFRGSVKSVAVLPDQGGWLSSGVKVYKTIVTIDEDVTKLKPGMTAVVQIDVDRLEDVLSVPVQAIVQRANNNWLYVQENGKLARRPVTLGKTNDKFVHVLEGVQENESVVLNPDSIIEEQEAREKEKMGEREANETNEKGDGEGTSDDEEGQLGKQPGPPGAGGQRPGVGAGPGGPGARGPGAGGPGKGRRGFDISQLDQDGDGKLSKEEVPEPMRPMFDRFDRDQSGFIEAGEMRMPGMRRPGAGGPGAGGPGAGGPGAGGPGAGGPGAGGPGAGGPGQGRRGFDISQLDQDGDGKLSKEEVPEPMRPMFDRFDRDQSGFIEAGEMRMPGSQRSEGGGPGMGRGPDNSGERASGQRPGSDRPAAAATE
jgi:HlyD family secretion protein